MAQPPLPGILQLRDSLNKQIDLLPNSPDISSIYRCRLLFLSENVTDFVYFTFPELLLSVRGKIKIEVYKTSLPKRINVQLSTIPLKILLLKNFIESYFSFCDDIIGVIGLLVYRTIFRCEKCEISLEKEANHIYHLHRCRNWHCDNQFYCNDCRDCAIPIPSNRFHLPSLHTLVLEGLAPYDHVTKILNK